MSQWDNHTFCSIYTKSLVPISTKFFLKPQRKKTKVGEGDLCCWSFRTYSNMLLNMGNWVIHRCDNNLMSSLVLGSSIIQKCPLEWILLSKNEKEQIQYRAWWENYAKKLKNQWVKSLRETFSQSILQGHGDKILVAPQEWTGCQVMSPLLPVRHPHYLVRPPDARGHRREKRSVSEKRSTLGWNDSYIIVPAFLFFSFI